MSSLTIDNSKRIMITGGNTISSEICFLSHLAGYSLIESDYNLVSNGSKGVDLAVAEGALMACLLNDYEPYKRIKVFRPLNHPVPEFDFGHLRIVGTNLQERRDFALEQCNVIVVMAGGSGTEAVVRRARELDIPLLAIGIGSSNEAAVAIWGEICHQAETDRYRGLSKEDLAVIGPNQYDLRVAAQGIVNLCSKLLRPDRTLD